MRSKKKLATAYLSQDVIFGYIQLVIKKNRIVLFIKNCLFINFFFFFFVGRQTNWDCFP